MTAPTLNPALSLAPLRVVNESGSWLVMTRLDEAPGSQNNFALAECQHEAEAVLFSAAPDLLSTLKLDLLFHSRPFARQSLADFVVAGYTGTEDVAEMRAWLEERKVRAVAKAEDCA